MRRVMMIAVVLAMVACKKDKAAAPAETGGSAAATASGSAPATNPPAPAADPTPTATETAKVTTDTGSAAAPATGSGAAPMAPTAPATNATPGARPASVTDAQVATLDKMFAAMTDLGKAITAAGKDCKAIAGALTANVEKLKPVMADAGKLQATLAQDQAAMEWFSKTYQPKMMALAGPIMGAQQQCGADKDYQAASAKLQAEMTKHAGP